MSGYFGGFPFDLFDDGGELRGRCLFRLSVLPSGGGEDCRVSFLRYAVFFQLGRVPARDPKRPIEIGGELTGSFNGLLHSALVVAVFEIIPFIGS